MKQFNFLDFALENGYGKLVVPNEILSLILKFENHVNSEVKNLNIPCVVGRSEQLPHNPITDKEHEDLMKALYPKDNSKRFRR